MKDARDLFRAVFRGALVPPTVHTTYTQRLFWAASIWSWALLLSCPKHRQTAAPKRWEPAHRILQKKSRLCASDLRTGCTVCEPPMEQRISWGIKTSVEAVFEIPDPQAKDETQQIKLCVSTSSTNGIWKRDATLLHLSRLPDQVDELWEGRGESEVLNPPWEDVAIAKTKTGRNKRKTLSGLLLRYHWEADQKRQKQQNHESWLLQGHRTGEGFQTRT